MIADAVVDWLRRVVNRPAVDESRYELQEEIGRSGAGVIWSTHDRRLERTVALVVLERDDSEARLLAKLEHPGIPPVYETGQLEDGRAFYTTRLLDGTDLDSHSEGLPLGARLRLFLQICDAVAFAHSRGVIHGRLNSFAVVIGAKGEVLVTRWRVPRRGDEPGAIADDVYSLGVMLEKLTQRQLAAVVDTATHAEEGSRYQNVPALRDDVARFLDDPPARESVLQRYRLLIWLFVIFFAIRLIQSILASLK